MDHLGSARMPASRTTRTAPSRSFIAAKGVTLPGSTPRCARSLSVDANERCPAPIRRPSALRSTGRSSSVVTSHISPFLFLTNRFFTWAPASPSPRWRFACSTVKTGGWVASVVRAPRRSSAAKRGRAGSSSSQRVVEHAIAVEDEAAPERAPGEHERDPEAVVGPHLVEGDGVERGPDGDRLVGLAHLARTRVGGEHVALEPVAVGELEGEVPAPARGGGADADLLARLADGRLLGRLPRLDAPARRADLPRAEAALLADEERLAPADDEEQDGDVRGGPGGPVDVGQGAHGARRGAVAAGVIIRARGAGFSTRSFPSRA